MAIEEKLVARSSPWESAPRTSAFPSPVPAAPAASTSTRSAPRWSCFISQPARGWSPATPGHNPKTVNWPSSDLLLISSAGAPNAARLGWPRFPRHDARKQNAPALQKPRWWTASVGAERQRRCADASRRKVPKANSRTLGPPPIMDSIDRPHARRETMSGIN